MGSSITLFSLSGTTLYSQLASVFRGRIARGEWPVGSEIPTLDELCAQYGVARVSARQAVHLLSEEGLLSTRRGRRTVVISAGSRAGAPLTNIAAALEQVPGFRAQIVEKIEQASLPAFAAGLGKADRSYVKIRKIDHDGEEPYAISDVYIAKSIQKRFPRRAEESVKISRLVRGVLQAPLLSAREKITVAVAGPEESAALKYPLSSPTAVVQRVYIDAEGRVVYAGWSVYRGDRFLVERELVGLEHGEVARATWRPNEDLDAGNPPAGIPRVARPRRQSVKVSKAAAPRKRSLGAIEE